MRSPEICEKLGVHREHDMGYLDWFDYCEEKTSEGEEQIQCPDCGLWIWPEFWGKK